LLHSWLRKPTVDHLMENYKIIFNRLIILFALSIGVLGCAPAPPKKPRDLCSIFRQYPRWYRDAKRSQKRWGVPVSVQMAIIHQESRFKAYAKPPRKKILWIIPWARPTSAEGYAQAVNGTWRLYLRETKRSRASRSSFSAATDFIGWFGYRAHRRSSISRSNAYALYLAYHEGIGGYKERTYLKKPWLVSVARNVSRLAMTYHWQLVHCEKSLPKQRWWWPF
jgi:hypothetical protein